MKADPVHRLFQAGLLLPGLGRVEAHNVMEDDALRALSPLVLLRYLGAGFSTQACTITDAGV